MCAPASPNPNCITAIPGILQAVAQRMHVLGDIPEILRKKWQPAQSLAHGGK